MMGTTRVVAFPNSAGFSADFKTQVTVTAIKSE
jgi:hypothetical protein